MKIIITGAGQVGQNIAALLSQSNNDVTVIDSNPDVIAHVNKIMDVRGITGYGSNPATLSAAGASDADMLIAVTHSDEVNMVACQVAHSLFNVPHKIARIREQAYRDPQWSNLFSRAHMPIDTIISPELEVAASIAHRLSLPGSTDVIDFYNGETRVVGTICHEDCPLVNTALDQMGLLFPDMQLKIFLIMRKGEMIVPQPHDQMLIGDEVFFLCADKDVKRCMAAFGYDRIKSHKIMIVGGGNIGLALAENISKQKQAPNVKIIEYDEARARDISQQLDDKVMVLQGDALQHEVMDEINIENADVLVAVTNDDETNILAALLAKQKGCKRVMSLVNKTNYGSLMNYLDIDAFISPRQITASTIVHYVRQGRIKGIYALKDRAAEIYDVYVHETMPISGQRVDDLSDIDGASIIAIHREGKMIIPDAGFTIKHQDRVLILALDNSGLRLGKWLDMQVALL